MRDMKERKPELVTERLVLKALEDDDREALLRMAADARVNRTYMIPDFADAPQADAFFRRLQAFSRLAERFLYGIFLNGRLIGIVNECGRDGNTVEIGYFTDPAYWNRGYATEAVHAAIGELFRIGWGTVRAGYFEENTASRRVMEKCGMIPIPEETEIPWRGVSHRCLFCEIRNQKL